MQIISFEIDLMLLRVVLMDELRPTDDVDLVITANPPKPIYHGVYHIRDAAMGRVQQQAGEPVMLLQIVGCMATM